jgi:hypothetical protein
VFASALSLEKEAKCFFVFPGGVEVNCPKCGKKMTAGWLYGQGAVLWTPRAGKLTALLGKADVDLQRGGKDPPAWICRDCRTVIVEYQA